MAADMFERNYNLPAPVPPIPAQDTRSRWFIIDRVFCFAVIILNSIMIITTYGNFVIRAIIGAVFALVFTHYAKSLYDSEKPRSAAFKVITGAVRGLLYAAAIIITLLPYTMRLSYKWYYPVQRYVYTEGYNKDSPIHELLPKKLPEKTDDYKAVFSPSMGQGDGGIDITFITDDAGIAQLRSRAVNSGATHLFLDKEDEELYNSSGSSSGSETKVNPGTWIDILARDGKSPADMEVYDFEERYHVCGYVLNAKTGYVMIRW